MLSDSCLSNSCQYTWFATGFGYHSDTNDYKLVKLFCFRDASFDFNVLPTVAVVYTSSSDSWKRVVVPLEPNGGAVDNVYDFHLFATFLFIDIIVYFIVIVNSLEQKARYTLHWHTLWSF
uniref:Uncharacterized protein n=1 Tax=Quercus lobata TaxID=97700 RepID=A0A7N2LMU9_QUELO